MKRIEAASPENIFGVLSREHGAPDPECAMDRPVEWMMLDPWMDAFCDATILSHPLANVRSYAELRALPS